jgi:hypothetical protein
LIKKHKVITITLSLFLLVLLLLALDAYLVNRDEVNLAMILGGDSAQYIPRPFSMNPKGDLFPLNYFEKRFTKGITPKDEVEQTIKGYTKKEKVDYGGTYYMQIYYFKIGTSLKGVIVSFDRKNIYQGIQFD